MLQKAAHFCLVHVVCGLLMHVVCGLLKHSGCDATDMYKDGLQGCRFDLLHHPLKTNSR